MSDTGLIILGVVGLGGLYLLTRKTPTAVGTMPTSDNNTTGFAPQPSTPRDPGDVNNWLPSLITSLGQIGSSAINTFGSQSSQPQSYSSSTPDGWVDPGF